MYHWFQRGWNWLEQALFPKLCLRCETHGSYACPFCLTKINLTRQLKCPTCHKTSPLGEFCLNCKKDEPALNGLWSATAYADPLIKKLIKTFKYEGILEINDILSHLIWSVLKAHYLPPHWHNLPLDKWIISPVPLHKTKQRWRGFNQAELMAKKLSQLTGLKFDNSLIRQRRTFKQSRLNDSWRQSNLKDAFILADNINPAGKIYLLIDDIYTSGATLENCARVLKQAGAVEVWGAVVAKG